MDILLIDRDSLNNQLIRKRLEEAGHNIVEEPSKSDGADLLKQQNFEAVLFDPAPLSEPKSMVSNLRRASKEYPYLIIMSKELDEIDVLRSGANLVLNKPVDADALREGLDNADRLTHLIRRIGDEAEDFPSAGGVIAKSAFNQLFLSCFDRAGRYGERSYMVFIGIRNYKQLIESDGPYAAEYAAAKVASYLSQIRRQSDIIAQTGQSEYCLLLQRPQTPTEPEDAANRFGESISKLEDVCISSYCPVEVYVTLIDVPVGKVHVQHLLRFTKDSAQKMN